MASQSEIKYNRLMEKAEELFGTLGYKAVSMDQIAEAAGISKMTIYKYFHSKEDLFLNVLQSIMDKAYAHIEDKMNSTEGALEKIDVLLNYSIEYSNKYSLTFFKDIMDHTYIAEKIIQEKKRVSQIIFEDIIRHGIERGEIREDVDEVFIATMLIALTEGFGTDHFNSMKADSDIQEFTKKFYDFLKYGLLGGK